MNTRWKYDTFKDEKKKDTFKDVKKESCWQSHVKANTLNSSEWGKEVAEYLKNE